MVTDPVGYRLFRTIPETLFLMLGMPLDAAKAMAARYVFDAIEMKETAYRTDGVYVPKEKDLPLYFVELLFYDLPSVYADILAKAYTYLKQHHPGQPYLAVVLFANRALEPTELQPYQPLLDCGMLRRYFLDEMPAPADGPFGLAILGLIAQSDEQAAANARALVTRAKNEIQDNAERANLVQLIETVILYKLARLSREEVQAMLQIHDIRETPLFKEVIDEAKAEVLTAERQRTTKAITKLAARHMSAAEIADALGLDIDFVLKTLANIPNH